MFICEAVNQCLTVENGFQSTSTVDVLVDSALEWEENRSRTGNNTEIENNTYY